MTKNAGRHRTSGPYIFQVPLRENRALAGHDRSELFVTTKASGGCTGDVWMGLQDLFETLVS